jgi:hypothetical protein
MKDVLTRQFEPQPVRIEFHDGQAQNVAIAGSFSQWRTMPLVGAGSGRWIRVIFLTPGIYEYRFVVGCPGMTGTAPGRTKAFGNQSTALRTIRVRPAPIRCRSRTRAGRLQAAFSNRSLPRQNAFERSKE